MDREMRNDNGEVVAREAEGPGYASGPEVVATGTNSLDQALHRERGNFTIEGRGEEIPAPPQRIAAPRIIPSQEEFEAAAEEIRREMSDASGRFNSANDVLLNRPATEDEGQRRLEAEIERMRYEQQIDETLRAIRDVPAEIMTTNTVPPAVEVRQEDPTVWTLAGATGTGVAEWTAPTLGEMRIFPTGLEVPAPVPEREYYCPQCGMNVRSTFKISLNEDERGTVHEYRWCSKCLCRALHQLVPLVRPIQETR